MSTPPTNITVEANVNAPIEKVWDLFTNPDHVTKWNNASDDWHTPSAKNDLQPGGAFVYRMEAKDGSMGFDFGGVYQNVEKYKEISYTIGDGRKVEVVFTANGDETHIRETFEAESTNPVEMQKAGWQNIMDNFKKYAEQKA